jgi:hypothetical protein
VTRETDPSPVKSSIEKLVAWASVAYAAGFVTIVIHTARLNIPVLELLEPIYVWVGAPLALVAFFFHSIVQWLRRKGREVATAYSEAGSLRKHLLGGEFALPIPIGPFGIVQTEIPLRGRFGKIVGTAIWAVVIYSATMRALRLATYVVLGVGAILAYVWFLYPKVPYSLGGGSPAVVRLALDSEKIPPQLPLLFREEGTAPGVSNPTRLTEPLQLLYATESTLFVRAAGEIVSVERNDVTAIVWCSGGLTSDCSGRGPRLRSEPRR